MPTFTVRYSYDRGANRHTHTLTVECSRTFAEQRAAEAVEKVTRTDEFVIHSIQLGDNPGGPYELVDDWTGRILVTGPLPGLLDEARGCGGLSIYRASEGTPLIRNAGSQRMTYHPRDHATVYVDRRKVRLASVEAAWGVAS